MSARGKAPKAIVTSDVTRPRLLALSAIGAVAGVGIAAGVAETPLGGDRPLPRPHAAIACAKCHEAPSTASSATALATPPSFHEAGACKTCHGVSHASTRPAHRALAAKGELTCATCHRQHAGAQGVTFGGGAEIVRWGSGASDKVSLGARTGTAEGAIPKGTTVPLVSLSTCVRCHDPTSARDPIAACVPASVRAGSARATGSPGSDPRPAGASEGGDVAQIASLCFDEHRALGERTTPSSAEVCTVQHGAARFVAWDAAREIAQTTPWVKPERADKPPWIPAGGALAGALVVSASAAAVARRRRRGSKPTALPAAPPSRKRLPIVDPTTCLGCYACVDACPFDVLAIERYVAVVARPEECCGVVTCEQVCPNGSLRVADGEAVLDRPRTDEHLESVEVRGLFVAGDLTGLPLIKNAINQGVLAIDRLAATLPRRRSAEIDVVVIGGGPAGLSAALRAKEKGLTSVVLEQATIAASIKSFPRDKIVHDPPLELPVEGELWLREATKEELVSQWTRIVRARALDVREGHRVVDIARDGEGFVVTAEHENGPPISLRASRVVLAIGRRGTPRRLDLAIEPGTEDRVAYALADARSFAGKKVVVVGLGDSAMEAAIALARQPGTTVTISYRGARHRRGKSRNVGEIESLVAQRKLRVLFETVPVGVTRSAVVLAPSKGGSQRQAVPADALLVLIGGVPSWDLLTRAGIRRPRKADVAPELEPSRI